MSVNLSPVGGVAAQFSDNNGNPLSGGLLYTYASGTTTPQTAYTTSQGNVAHANPIVLNSGGRVSGSGEVWLTDGANYKFVLKDANSVLIATYDDISGINSTLPAFTNAQEIQTATANQTIFTLLTTSYSPATNSLSVYVNGVNQYGPGAQYAYTETSSMVVTFTNGLNVGSSVKFTTTQQQSAGIGNADQITYDPAGTGAVATTVQGKLRESVSVKDFGAVGDGVTDDTAAFNLAHTYAASVNKSVFIQSTAAGYNIAGTIVVKTSMFGEGMLTTLITSNASLDVIQCAATLIVLSDFAITSSVTRTGGSYIRFNGAANANNFCRVERMLLSNWFNGITWAGGGSTSERVTDVRLITNIAGGIGITQSTTQNAVDVVFSNTLIIGPTTGAQCTAGVQIQNVGDCTLNHVITVKTGIGLNVNPQAGQNVQALWVSDCQFDSGSSQGINTNPAVTGVIKLMKVLNTWCATNANGVVLMAGGTGSQTQTEFINCTLSNNIGHGLIVAGAGMQQLSVNGGSMSANVHGIIVNAAMNGLTIIGVTSGPDGNFSGNSGDGIRLNNSLIDNYVISSNRLQNNTGSALVNNSTGTSAYVVANLGVNPGGTSGQAVGASPYSYKAGASTETIYIGGGAVSNVVINGQSTGLSTNATYRLGPKQTMVITYSSVPSMIKTIE